MSSLTVVVTDPNLLPLRAELESLVPPGTEMVWATDSPSDECTEGLEDADVLVGPKLTRAMAAAASRLRLVQVAGAGLDRIDPLALGETTAVANTYHHERPIAEYIVWALVALRRDLVQVDADLRQGRWRSPVYDRRLRQPSSLQAAQVGFFGFGRIGQAAWRALQVFGAQGRAVTSSGRAVGEGLCWAGDSSELPRLIEESDVLVVSCPLTPATRGMIGAPELAALGTDSVLVNVARGPVVQEQALYEALRDRKIRGAALDVWYSYPTTDARGLPAQAPFSTLENVLMTPHVSGLTRQTFLGRVQDIAANITALAQGEALRNVVDLPTPTTRAR